MEEELCVAVFIFLAQINSRNFSPFSVFSVDMYLPKASSIFKIEMMEKTITDHNAEIVYVCI